MRTALLLALAALAPRAVPAQSDSSPATPGSRLEIYVMTMGPGAEIWERFGHNAIGVRDLDRGTDIVYNYGTFSFDEPGFLLHFVEGRLRYWLAAAPAQWTVDFYRDRRHRSVLVQELDFTPDQRAAMRDFLEWNAREENKYYRYDYYRDNCSTRVRDAVDRIIGGRLRALTDTMATGTTYRSHTQRLTTNNPAMYTALLAVMGHPVDRPITAWEEMFLPIALPKYLRQVTLTDTGGGTRPLVRSETEVYESDRYQERTTQPHWGPWYLLAGVTVSGLALLLVAGAREYRAARTGFAMLATLWYLVLGVGGVILIGLWAFTDHEVAYRNENVLQFNLLALPLVVLVPLAVRRREWAERAALRWAVVIAGISFVGLLLKALPMFDQVNLQLITLILPVNLAMVAALVTLRRLQPSDAS